MRLRCARCGCYVSVEGIDLGRLYWAEPARVAPCARCLREAQYTTDKEWMELLGDEFYYPMRLVEE